MRGKVLQRNGRTWTYVVDLGQKPGGGRNQKWKGGYATKRQAEEALTKALAEFHRGDYVEPSRLTLGGFLKDQWLPAIRSSVRSGTWDSYERIVDSAIMPRIGSHPLQGLTGATLNAFYGDLLREGRKDGRGGLAPKSVRNIHVVIRKALDDALRWSLVARNVAVQANPPRLRGAGDSDMRTWAAEQVRTFLDGIGDHRFHPALVLAASTGMRRGEVLGLRWQDIDFSAKRLAVRNTLLSVAYKIERGTPKTARGRRSLPLDGTTLAVLRSHRARQAEERLAWGPLYEDNGLVFTREDGRPIHPDLFSKVFDQLVARSKLPRIRLHDYADLRVMPTSA